MDGWLDKTSISKMSAWALGRCNGCPWGPHGRYKYFHGNLCRRIINKVTSQNTSCTYRSCDNEKIIRMNLCYSKGSQDLCKWEISGFALSWWVIVCRINAKKVNLATVNYSLRLKQDCKIILCSDWLVVTLLPAPCRRWHVLAFCFSDINY